MLKVKIDISTAKPVFRQKYAFYTRHSRNNVASLSLEEFRSRPVNDKPREIGGPNDRTSAFDKSDDRAAGCIYISLSLAF